MQASLDEVEYFLQKLKQIRRRSNLSVEEHGLLSNLFGKILLYQNNEADEEFLKLVFFQFDYLVDLKPETVSETLFQV